MEKITLQTPNLIAQNIDKIAELFPNCITETKDENGTLKKAINFDVLKQMLSEDVIEGGEAYEFTWVGKKAATVEAFKSINKTLRPCPEESVDWEKTQNLYIEGDNLEVLKLLQESYLKKVKMIYIDPPYNTGNDFIYKDGFQMTKEEWKEESDEYDDEGNRLYRNTESNGRFHSDWCSMIYSRLLLARGLLTDDGVIFISIDDHEVDNLKKICDEVFGNRNFIACVAWQRNYAPISLKKFFSESHEYCLIYAKNINEFQMNLLPRTDKQNKDYTNPDNDPRGAWKVGNLTVGPAVEKQIYEIIGPTGKRFLPPSGYCWRFTKERFDELRADNRIWFGSDGNNSPVPKLFLSEVQNGVTPMTLWTYEEAGHNQIATRELRDIFGASIFTSPKPVKYIKRYLQIGLNPGDIVLDFFSGSATTAHAVMQLNAEDGGNRRFIMVQIPEVCDEKSEAYKAGYENICEIGKERIRRAGAKIKESMAQDDSLFSSSAPGLDTGFRVFKVADSNMNDVDIQLSLYSQDKLDQMVENIKPDRTALDLLFGSALEWGYELTLPYTSQQVDGYTIHTYSTDDKVLMACFDKNIPESVFRYIAKQTPKCAVFRDCCFEDCPSKINAEEIIKTLSPDTDVRVI